MHTWRAIINVARTHGFDLIPRPHFSAFVKRFLLLRRARSNCIPTIHVFPNDVAEPSTWVPACMIHAPH